jgi:small subunit ribosomal protein S16
MQAHNGHRTARNSKPLEVLGTYDPIPKPPTDGEGKPFKDIKLDSARAKYWLGVGAQPSDPAWRLLSMVCDLSPQLAHDWEKKVTWVECG